VPPLGVKFPCRYRPHRDRAGHGTYGYNFFLAAPDRWIGHPVQRSGGRSGRDRPLGEPARDVVTQVEWQGVAVLGRHRHSVEFLIIGHVDPADPPAVERMQDAKAVGIQDR